MAVFVYLKIRTLDGICLWQSISTGMWCLVKIITRTFVAKKLFYRAAGCDPWVRPYLASEALRSWHRLDTGPPALLTLFERAGSGMFSQENWHEWWTRPAISSVAWGCSYVLISEQEITEQETTCRMRQFSSREDTPVQSMVCLGGAPWFDTSLTSIMAVGFRLSILRAFCRIRSFKRAAVF